MNLVVQVIHDLYGKCSTLFQRSVVNILYSKNYIIILIAGAMLEWVPWVPVTPLNFQTSYVKAVEILENIMKLLKKRGSEPVD